MLVLAGTACQWKVTSKLNFQQQKILKKKLKRIGCDDIKDYTDELKEKVRASHLSTRPIFQSPPPAGCASANAWYQCGASAPVSI
jgi:hypothetical protein